MKRLISFLLILIMLLAIVSCNIQSGGSSNPGGDNPGDENPGNDNPGGEDEKPGPNYPEDELAAFNALFDPKNHIAIKLDISDSELKKIQEDYEHYSSFGSKSPIYRMADLQVTVTEPSGNVYKWVIDQVGVRMKGNTSRTDFYSDEEGMYNLIHFKISFGETFDEEEYYGSDAVVWTDDEAREERKDRTFATLEKIDIRWNKNDDTTYIRENYAYEVYREFGVLAPHTNLASVDIGDDHAGVWVIYEPVDKIFLEKNLPESALGGDLYKLGWASHGADFASFSSYGVEDEDKGEFFAYDLKTNKKKSTHQSLEALINGLTSSSATKDSISELVDIENFMNYCAVSYLIGNPDDLRNNYNNSYIYFRKDNGKMIVIPYDNDRGLGVNTWNPYGHGMTTDDPFTRENVTGSQRSPLFLKTVCLGGYFVEEYIEALKRVDESSLLTNDSFEAAVNLAASVYSGDTATSKTYNNARRHQFAFDLNRTCGPWDSNNMSFADYISAKRATLKSALDNFVNDGTGDFGDLDYDCMAYIRSTRNSWSIQESDRMTKISDGIYSFVIECKASDDFRFKVFDDITGRWYGGEVLDEASESLIVRIDSHTNIVLGEGKFTVTFNNDTHTISITKE